VREQPREVREQRVEVSVAHPVRRRARDDGGELTRVAGHQCVELGPLDPEHPAVLGRDLHREVARVERLVRPVHERQLGLGRRELPRRVGQPLDRPRSRRAERGEPHARLEQRGARVGESQEEARLVLGDGCRDLRVELPVFLGPGEGLGHRRIGVGARRARVREERHDARRRRQGALVGGGARVAGNLSLRALEGRGALAEQALHQGVPARVRLGPQRGRRQVRLVAREPRPREEPRDRDAREQRASQRYVSDQPLRAFGGPELVSYVGPRALGHCGVALSGGSQRDLSKRRAERPSHGLRGGHAARVYRPEAPTPRPGGRSPCATRGYSGRVSPRIGVRIRTRLGSEAVASPSNE
jgi:hypothetical protein